MDIQHNCQKKKDKTRNNDLQSTSQKTNDRATQTSLITLNSSCICFYIVYMNNSKQLLYLFPYCLPPRGEA
jgi:hypothetical protein